MIGTIVFLLSHFQLPDKKNEMKQISLLQLRSYICSDREPSYCTTSTRFVMGGPVHAHSKCIVLFGHNGGMNLRNISQLLVQIAIKFFMEKKAFERETALYNVPTVQAIMPRILAIDDNGQAGQCTPYVFPPFVIIEQGQSLDEWAADTANKDFITILQVCVYLCAGIVGTGNYSEFPFRVPVIFRRMPYSNDAGNANGTNMLAAGRGCQAALAWMHVYT